MENKTHVNDVELYLSKNTDPTLSTNYIQERLLNWIEIISKVI